MGRSFARCTLVIVAGEAASRYARVVEGHCRPERCALVAIIAGARSLQMGLALANGWRTRAVMAIGTLTLTLGMIEAGDWRPDSRCVAGRAIVRCQEVGCCLSNCWRMVVVMTRNTSGCGLAVVKLCRNPSRSFVAVVAGVVRRNVGGCFAHDHALGG